MAKERNTEVEAVAAQQIEVSGVTFTIGEILDVPLSALVISPHNVRKQGGEDVAGLAALIMASGGQPLQNLVVHAMTNKRGKPTGVFGVAAGGRRMAACQLNASRGLIHADTPIRALLVSEAQAIEMSLAENSEREPMHEADTITAFATLADSGMTPDEIAFKFGVTPLLVQRRSKLARVAPELIALLRADEIELRQLEALAATDDHESQLRVWNDAPTWNRSPDCLRDAIMGERVKVRGNRLASFVGLDAYREAGGTIHHDLFAEDHDDPYGGSLDNVELLTSLASTKLEQAADEVRAEGWKWVKVDPTMADHEIRSFPTLPKSTRKPSVDEAANIWRLEKAYDEAASAVDAAYESDDDTIDTDALETKAQDLNAELEAAQEALAVVAPDAVKLSGAIVTLDRAGKLCIHRGRVAPEDRKAVTKQVTQASDQTESEGGASSGGKPTESQSLTYKLTSHRTAALQVMLADNAHVALAAIVHALAQPLLCDGYRTMTAVEIRATACGSRLTSLADDMEESKAWTELQSRQDAWRDRLPGDTDRLLPWLLSQDDSVLLDLLALCVALSTNAITSTERKHEGDALAAALGLDMADWWEPTASSYLSQVPKARILTAVSEAVSPTEAAALGNLKKAEAVAKAEALLSGKRWLPSLLKQHEA